MKILITNTYFYKLDAKQWAFKQPYPPLGTLQVAAVLRENFDVKFFDNNLADSARDIFPVLASARPTYFIIYDDGFNYLTKMCLTVMRDAAFAMATEAKRLGATVIISSSDAADHYEKYFEHGVDVVVRGEGEETMRELLFTLRDNKSIESVNGIAFRGTDGTVVTPPRPVIRDLDSLPMPAWDLIDPKPYRELWLEHHNYFSLNVATTRGCPYKCNWCAKPIYGNRYNARSPQHVVNEIAWLVKLYQPDHIWMCDDIFGLKPGWVQAFSDEVKKQGLTFRYKIQSRADLVVSRDTVEALAHSGAETVWIGAESGSQKILDAMDKGITVEQIKAATELLKSQHIRVAFFLQFGYLGELQHDIEKTIDMVLQLMPDEIGISVSYPLPGTVFYDKVKTMLQEKQNWSDSDDLAMMYKSTFSSDYYKKLHRFVHNRYRVQRGINQWTKSGNESVSTKTKIRHYISMFYNLPLMYLHGFQLKQLSR